MEPAQEAGVVAMVTSRKKPSAPGRTPLLMRGESFVAPCGLALAAILLGALAGAAWWSMRTQQDALRDARLAQVRATGEALAASLVGELRDDDLAGARLLVMEAGRTHELDVCRLLLGDGRVVAASGATASVDVRALPEVLPEVTIPDTGSAGGFTLPVLVGDRGRALLEIQAGAAAPVGGLWRVQVGVGAIGAAALCALLVVYRRLRGRLRGVSAIRESLLAMNDGHAEVGALRVNPTFGAEAVAWNALLDSREQLRRQALADKAKSGGVAGPRAAADLAGACDAMWQGLILVDDEAKVKYANGAAAVYLGKRRDDAIGASIENLLDNQELLGAVRGVARGEMRRRETIELRREGEHGPTVLRFSIRPVRKDDSASAVILIEDITQQRIADESRNAFVAQATHELRTPLTNIRLYVEEAVDCGEEDPAIRAKCLNVISQESRRLERIVADMLSVAEIEAGSLTLRRGDVRTDTLFTELKEEYAAQADEKNVSLIFELPPKLPTISGDRDKIGLALHNLIGNALKYTPSGGSVTVSLACDEETITINVSDTGIGISEADAEHVFDKFYRAKDQRIESVTGTGLGLALAREVVRLHGGDIDVMSELNKGSVFTLTLPVAQRQAA